MVIIRAIITGMVTGTVITIRGLNIMGPALMAIAGTGGMGVVTGAEFWTIILNLSMAGGFFMLGNAAFR
jgi:hypothetical protein